MENRQASWGKPATAPLFLSLSVLPYVWNYLSFPKLLEVIGNLTPISPCGLASQVGQLNHRCSLRICWDTSRLKLEVHYLPNVTLDPMSQANPFPSALSSPSGSSSVYFSFTWSYVVLSMENLAGDINSLYKWAVGA